MGNEVGAGLFVLVVLVGMLLHAEKIFFPIAFGLLIALLFVERYRSTRCKPYIDYADSIGLQVWCESRHLVIADRIQSTLGRKHADLTACDETVALTLEIRRNRAVRITIANVVTGISVGRLETATHVLIIKDASYLDRDSKREIERRVFAMLDTIGFSKCYFPISDAHGRCRGAVVFAGEASECEVSVISGSEVCITGLDDDVVDGEAE